MLFRKVTKGQSCRVAKFCHCEFTKQSLIKNIDYFVILPRNDVFLNSNMNIYQDIVSAKNKGKKLLAVLIDPEKIALKNIPTFLEKVQLSIAIHIFVGGSTDTNNQTEKVVAALKKSSSLPIVLFPGDANQITNKADGILFLSFSQVEIQNI